MESTHSRITVWYADESNVDGPSIPWHGEVVRMCIFKGYQVRFDNWPDDHPDKTMWVSRTEDEWAWGTHKRKPSRKARDASCLIDTGHMNRKRPRAKTSNHIILVACRGKRAWAGAWIECLKLLELLRRRMIDTMRLSSAKAKRVQQLDLRYVGLTSEGLDGLGMTFLTNSAIIVLGAVPPKLWSGRSWPLYNCDWSARLREAHTPESLVNWLKVARDECIQWPPTTERHIFEFADPGVASVSDLADGSRCFVCAYDSELQRHPRAAHGALRHVSICKDCSSHFKEVHSELEVCDEELLRLRCGACGHDGAAVHGCRTCGESLCERCLHCIHGIQGLQSARRHRFAPELCSGCGLDGTRDDSWRAVCDACRQQWHLPCHQPPLLEPPGGSQRWLCMDCELEGEPLTPSWSLRSCALCCAHAKSQGERRFLQVDQSRDIALMASKDFDHASALCALNCEIDATNQILTKSCELALDHDVIMQTAKQAVATGGVTVVSYCDGKGTLLGVLLRAGVYVRRYLSVERDENASRVCFSLYGGLDQPNLAPGGLRFYVEAAQLSVSKLKALDCWPVHLLMGATPCDDLSGCKAGAVGLDGPSSRLFKNYCSFLDSLRKQNGGINLCFLAENVKPTKHADQEEMLRLIKVPALQSEAAVFEAARRKRLFFSNMPFAHVPLNTPNILLQSILRPPAVALSTKAGCIISSTITGGRESIASAKAASQRNRGRELVRSSAHGTEVRGLLVDELAKALGQPPFEVDAARGGSQEKVALLGRSLAVGQIKHAVQTFIDACLAAQSLDPISTAMQSEAPLLLTFAGDTADSSATTSPAVQQSGIGAEATVDEATLEWSIASI